MLHECLRNGLDSLVTVFYACADNGMVIYIDLFQYHEPLENFPIW